MSFFLFACGFLWVDERGVTSLLLPVSDFGLVRKRKLLILIWLPPRDSNPDMLIQSQLSCR